MKRNICIGLVFLPLVISGCELAYQARIKPDDNFIVQSNTAIYQSKSVVYKLHAIGGNGGCCEVYIDIRNPTTKEMVVDLTTARIQSSCIASKEMQTPLTFRKEGAKTFEEMSDALGSVDAQYSKVERPKTSSIPGHQVARYVFSSNERWKKECLPYRFSLELPGDKPVNTTFYKIE